MLGEFKIPVLLLAFFDFTPFGTEVAFLVTFLVGKKLLLADGVEALVGFFVELPLFVQVGKDFLNAGFVAGVGGFGPTVVRDIKGVEEFGEFFGVLFGEGRDVDAFFFGGLDHFLPMLIDSGEVVDFFSAKPVIAG